MKEFTGYINTVADRSYAVESTSAIHDDIKWTPVKAASFEINTDGPFPLDVMRELVGRRVKVTILD